MASRLKIAAANKMGTIYLGFCEGVRNLGRVEITIEEHEDDEPELVVRWTYQQYERFYYFSSTALVRALFPEVLGRTAGRALFEKFTRDTAHTEQEVHNT